MKKIVVSLFIIASLVISAFAVKQEPPEEAWTVTTIAGWCADYGLADGDKPCFDKAGPMVIDAAGNLFVVDDNTGACIRKVAPNGATTTLLASNYKEPKGVVDYKVGTVRGIVLDKNGDIIFSDRGASTILKLSGDNKVETIAAATGYSGKDDGPAMDAELDAPNGICMDKQGNIYIADGFNFKIRKLSADRKTITTFAGNGVEGELKLATGKAAGFKQEPQIITVDSKGNVYLVQEDVNSCILKITPSGVVTVFVGDFSQPSNKEKDGTGKAAGFPRILAMCCDAQDNLYVAEAKRVRKITPAAVVTTIAGVDDDNDHRDGSGSRARFSTIRGLCADAAGNIYVGDSYSIRKLSKQ